MAAPILLPAAEIAALHAALCEAMAAAESSSSPYGERLWDRLNSARAFVQVYLLDQMAPAEVEIVREVA